MIHPDNGALPLLTPDEVVPIHYVQAQCELPKGRHEVQLGFDYTNRILRYRMSFQDQPNLEVLSGTVIGDAPIHESNSGSAYDIAVLLDCSGSMLGKKLTNAKAAVHKLLQITDGADVRTALVSFGGTARVDAVLSSSLQEMNEAVERLSADGGTPMAEAIELGERELDNSPSERNQMVVVVTDGQPNQASTTAENAVRLKANGIRLVAVGIGEDVSEHYLQYHIASTPKDYFFASAPEELLGIFASIAELYIV